MYVIFQKDEENKSTILKILFLANGTYRQWVDIEETIWGHIENIGTEPELEKGLMYVYESYLEEIFVLREIKPNTSNNAEVLLYNGKMYTLNEW